MSQYQTITQIGADIQQRGQIYKPIIQILIIQTNWTLQQIVFRTELSERRVLLVLFGSRSLGVCLGSHPSQRSTRSSIVDTRLLQPGSCASITNHEIRKNEHEGYAARSRNVGGATPETVGSISRIIGYTDIAEVFAIISPRWLVRFTVQYNHGIRICGDYQLRELSTGIHDGRGWKT